MRHRLGSSTVRGNTCISVLQAEYPGQEDIVVYHYENYGKTTTIVVKFGRLELTLTLKNIFLSWRRAKRPVYCKQSILDRKTLFEQVTEQCYGLALRKSWKNYHDVLNFWRLELTLTVKKTFSAEDA